VQRKNNKIIFILVLSFILAGQAKGGSLLFIKENIALSLLSSDTLQVKGNYFFSTIDSLTSRAPLFYPFPVDSFAAFPYFIDVRDSRTLKKMSFEKQEQGIAFSIDVKSGDTTEVSIMYNQTVANSRGRYILLTTGSWGRPLVDSRYSVSVPKTLTLSYMSYECDSVALSGKRLIYSFFKKQFMPDRDLSFIWMSAENKKR
jgi:hypothetical protein